MTSSLTDTPGVRTGGGRPAGDVDPETGLWHPAAVAQHAAYELQRAKRYRRLLTMVVLELPEDARTGAPLHALADQVRRQLRESDLAGYLDAQGLVLLLPETPLGGGQAFIRRLRDGCATAGLPSPRATAVAFPQDGQTWAALVRAALSRLEEPERPPVPNADLRGRLRAAFPAFGQEMRSQLGLPEML